MRVACPQDDKLSAKAEAAARDIFSEFDKGGKGYLTEEELVCAGACVPARTAACALGRLRAHWIGLDLSSQWRAVRPFPVPGRFCSRVYSREELSA